MLHPVRRLRLIATLAALGCVLVFVLFEIRLRPEFAMPRRIEKIDPAQEARYEQCVDARTDEATRRAFASADNPDVQGLMIRMQQQDAVRDCRAQYPELRVVVNEPLRFNVVDLSWRFGKR